MPLASQSILVREREYWENKKEHEWLTQDSIQRVIKLLPPLNPLCQHSLRTGRRFICFEPNADCWYRKPMLHFRNILGLYTDDEVFLRPGEVAQLTSEAGWPARKTIISKGREIES